MDNKTGTQSISRVIQVLKIIAQYGENGIRLIDLAETLSLPRPTVHRLLKALIVEGMLVQETDSRRYKLGPLIFELGLAAAHSFNLRDLCEPVLQELSQSTGDTAFLFVRNGNEAVCLNRKQGTYPIQTPSLPIGSRQPLGVNAGGLTLLANLTPKEAEEVLTNIAPYLASYGNLNVEELRQLTDRARERGYAAIANWAVPGVSAIGMPVISPSGITVAALTIAATETRMTQERVNEILPLLSGAVVQLSQLLRY